MLVRVWSNRNSHSAPGNGNGTLEVSLAVSYKTKYSLIIRCSNHVLSYLLKWAENLCQYKHLHTDVYSGFIYIFQNLEARISLSEWMDMLTVVHLTKYCWMPKRSEPSSHVKTWRKLRCASLSERSQSEKVPYCMIPIVWYSGKSNTM